MKILSSWKPLKCSPHLRKGCDFSGINDDDLIVIMNKLNNRPRKSLDYATPNEIYGEGISERNFRTITEYFVPSSKICFSKLAAFKSEKPRNISSSKFFHRRSEPLTTIILSKELTNQIENAVEQFDDPQEACNSLKNNEEYQSLFKIKPRKTTLVGNEIVFIKDGFWDSYKTKGNNIIKKAIIQYILDGTTPKETSLNDVVQLAKKLSSIEKESLVLFLDCTQ